MLGGGASAPGGIITAAPNCYSARTTDVDADQRISYWTEAFGAIWGRVELFTAGARPFYGDLQSVRIASLRVNRINFEGMAFKRQGQPPEPFYSLAFPQRGRSVVLEGSDCLELVPGAAYLVDNSRHRAELRAMDAYQTCNVQIPSRQLRERLGARWNGSSIRIQPDSLVLGLLKTLVYKLAQSGEVIDLRSAEFLERQICDLVAFCLSEPSSSCSDEGTILLAQRERTDRCIERLYARADLDPGRIAAACGISESYLHKIYRGTGRTPMGRVREVRLQAAHGLLRSIPSRITISEIAYQVGFKSLAEFSRAYKRRFGLSPQNARASLTPPRNVA
jgi:AraC-like DNA-binding protein